MRHILLSIIAVISFSYLQGQTLIDADSVRYYSEADIQNMGLIANNGVTFYRITYLTPDLSGTTDTASGALLVPDVDPCQEGHPLVPYHHGTVIRDDNVPSEQGSRESGLHFAADGYVVCMPDYLGLGENEGLHPYQHADSEASASIDMIRASREFMAGQSPLKLNGELYLTGYSQGGHSTVALHRHIEQKGMLDSFNVRISAPMSGAYDLSGVQSRFPQDSTYESPAYFAYIMESYKMVYGTLYDSIEAYYETPYDSLIPVYLSGDSTLNDFNDFLPDNIYDFVEDSVLDNFYADTVNFNHPLRLALAKNDLHKWGPDRMTRLLYCGQDEQVFPENAIVAEDSMTYYGGNDVKAIEVDPNAGHGGCAVPGFIEAKELFDSARTQCGASALHPHEGSKGRLEVRKRGVDRRQVTTPFSSSRYSIWSVQGKLLQKGRSKNKTFEFRTDRFPKGSYILRVREEKGKHSLAERFLIR